MPNIYTLNNTVYQPLDYDEMVAPLLRYKQNYDEQANALSEMQARAEAQRKIAEAERDRDDGYTYNMWSNYQNDLQRLADDLGTNGISNRTVPSMLNMKKRYSSEILPIEQANARREAMKELELKNPDSIFQKMSSDLTLRDFIQHPELNYQFEKKSDIYNRAKDAASAIRESFNTDRSTDYLKKKLPFMYEAARQSGASVQDILDVMDGKVSTKTAQLVNALAMDLYNGTNVSKWSNDPLDPDNEYEKQKNMALDLIRSGIHHALGKRTFDTQWDKYGMWLAEEDEKARRKAAKKAEEEGTEAPYSSKYGTATWRIGTNNKTVDVDVVDTTQNDVKAIVEGGLSATPKSLTDHYNMRQVLPEHERLDDTDGNIKDWTTYWNEINFNKMDDNVSGKLDKAKPYILKKFNEKMYSITGALDKIGFKYKTVKDEKGRIISLTDENGNKININSAFANHKEKIALDKIKAELDYIPFDGRQEYSAADAVLNLVNSGGGKNLIMGDQDSDGAPVFAGKVIESYDKDTGEYKFKDETITQQDLFDVKDGVKKFKKGISVNNVGITPDMQYIAMEITDEGGFFDDGSVTKILVPISNALTNEDMKVARDFNETYDKWIPKDLNKSEAFNTKLSDYKRQYPNLPVDLLYRKARYDYLKDVYPYLKKPAEALMERLFHDRKAESVQRL